MPRPYLPQPMWILSVLGPVGGVVADVLTNGVQLSFIADDTLIVVALPDPHPGRLADSVDAPGGHRLEIADDGSRRPRGWTLGMCSRGEAFL